MQAFLYCALVCELSILLSDLSESLKIRTTVCHLQTDQSCSDTILKNLAFNFQKKFRKPEN